MGYNLSLKINFLHSHLDIFPPNRGSVSGERGENFRPHFSTMETRYAGKSSQKFFADYCWNLMHKYFYSCNITILYMFRALLCSSSGGSIVYVQHLVPSFSVSDRTLHWLRENQCNVRPLTESDGTWCCTYTIEPPEDEQNNDRNMKMIIILYE